jgi:hypothetical protein
MAFTAKVITTAAWGAKPARANFALTTPRYVIVHHTDSKNPPNAPSQGTVPGAMRFARSIQNDHMNGNGWSDSGHNFLNTTSGTILEGRHGSLNAVKKGLCIQSAHAAQDPGKLANGNQSPGIENEGNFMAFQMGQQQWDSLVDLCASLCDSCNINPSNIKGHRDFSITDCPGDWLYNQLPQLRADVAKKLGLKLGAPSITLQLGDIGPAVLDLQQKLLDKGFSPGAIDGNFGDNTKEAVIKFQRSAGLTDDGVVGSQTRAKLSL